jgi:hypothetical protein
MPSVFAHPRFLYGFDIRKNANLAERAEELDFGGERGIRTRREDEPDQ